MWDGKIVNRILYADQFTDVVSECCGKYNPKNIDEVFEFFKPRKDIIELETEEGDIVFEDFVFQHLSDFDDKQLIANSKTLSSLYKSMNESESAKKCLTNNLSRIHKEILALEISYRTLDVFFSQSDGNSQLMLLNVNKEELANYSSDDSKAVLDELMGRSDDTYSFLFRGHGKYFLLIIPGYLGDASAVRMWAKSVYRNKMILITDFKDCSDFDTTVSELEKEYLQGEDDYLANVVMVCNYVEPDIDPSVGGEERKLFLPGSAALAGLFADKYRLGFLVKYPYYNKRIDLRSYKTKIKNLHLNLSDSQAGKLMDLGVVPIVKTNCEELISIRSLYNGEMTYLRDFSLILVLSVIENAIYDALLRLSYSSILPREHCLEFDQIREQDELESKINNYMYFNYFSWIDDYKILQVRVSPNIDTQLKRKIVVMMEVSVFGKSVLLEISCKNIVEKHYSLIQRWK